MAGVGAGPAGRASRMRRRSGAVSGFGRERSTARSAASPEGAAAGLCGRIGDVSDDWTIERHLRDKPARVVALHYRFIALAEACGPFDYAVAKTAVSLKGSRRGFAGAVPTAKALDGHFDLQRQVADPRIRRSSPYTRRLFVHHFRVTSLNELDDDFGDRPD